MRYLVTLLRNRQDANKHHRMTLSVSVNRVRVKGWQPATGAHKFQLCSESDAAAIRAAYERGGELSAAVELRRLFPGLANNENTLGKRLHNLTATR
jgi:hypothetical protein